MTEPAKEAPMSVRLLPAAAVFLLFAPLAPAGLSAQADPDRAVAGGGAIPAGWHVRTEPSRQTGQPAPLDNVKFTAMGDGLHTTVGPAAIYWRGPRTPFSHHPLAPKLPR